MIDESKLISKHNSKSIAEVQALPEKTQPIIENDDENKE